jgi:hypothetical protein
MEASYWKNCQKQILPSKPFAEIRSVFVQNGNIYTCGLDRDSITTFVQACYWINNQKFYLSDSFSVAYDIFVYDNSIYVCGAENNQACYWNNGEKSIIGNRFSEAKRIFINESGIYIGGEDWLIKSDYGVFVGWFWVNGTKTDLFYNEESHDILYSGSFEDMYVFDNQVYITGRDNFTYGPIYWENNHMVILKPYDRPINFYNANSYSIMVVDNNVIVGGNNNNNDCVWINGIRIDLFRPKM